MRRKPKPTYSTLERSLRRERKKFSNLNQRFKDMLLHNLRDNAKIESQARTITEFCGKMESKAGLIAIMDEELQKSRAKVRELERALVVASL